MFLVGSVRHYHITCLLQTVIFVCFIWMAQEKKLPHHHLGKCRFCFIAEYHFPPIALTPWLFFFNLSFFCLRVSDVFRFAFLYINHIIFNWFLFVCSQILVPLFFYLLCCTFSTHFCRKKVYYCLNSVISALRFGQIVLFITLQSWANVFTFKCA